jgi:signal transduction histidine kinase
MEMYPYYIGYIIILLISSAIGVLLLIRIWGLRSIAGAYGLLLAVGCVTEWSLSCMMEILSATMTEKVLWSKLEYIGISYVGLGIFIFAMHYSNRAEWLTPTRTALLAIIASFEVILALTNEWHHLIWSGLEFTNGLSFGPLSVVKYGTGFILFAVFHYTLIAVTTVTFFQVSARSQGLYRTQAQIMLAGMLFPWIANLMYVLGMNPYRPLDPTPVVLTMTNVFLSVSFLRYRFMELRPIAYDSVFNAIKDGVVVLDNKERIIDINPVGMLIFRDEGNLLGREIRTLLLKWDEWQVPGLQQEIEQEMSLEFAGEPLTFSLRTTSVLDRRGKRHGRVLLISDITEQKRAQKQILEASHLKSQLLANLGHDLRSPLGAIIGYAEMLKDGSFGPMSENQVKASSEILDGANQLLSFINNLVGQAQIETGKIVLREYPFDVNEVIGPLLSTLNYHAYKKGLRLDEYIDPALPQKLIGDQFWLRQIVMNLVHNAVKFTEKGSVTVRFLKHSRDTWSIQVVDTGIGIPPESQKRVFEAFEQVNSMENSKQSGFGLGLSIVAKLTSIMNGKIELESETGKGCTFTVVLPLKEAPV